MYYELIDLHNDSWINVFRVDSVSVDILNPYSREGGDYNNAGDCRDFIPLLILDMNLDEKDIRKAIRGKSVWEAAVTIGGFMRDVERKEYPKANMLLKYIIDQGHVAPKDELDKIDVMEALR